ncbi:MAG TPA: hypothetical protein DFS52_20430, partial [Myxococcales bacterium]|nr:hypothetical protein [Myxococcales bacterium]
MPFPDIARTIRERPTHAALAAAVAMLLGYALWLFTYAEDDAFIIYRYALNAVGGHGFVFNPGERTEGYSCPLYTFLTAVLMGAPGDVHFRAKLLGLTFAVATLWATSRLVSLLDLPPWARAAVLVLVGANGNFALAALNGMETSLQVLLVTMAAWSFVREEKQGAGWTSALWFLAAGLNRAEGGYACACAFLIAARAAWRERSRARRLTWALVFAAPMAAFFAWRWWYYGDLLPNTVYAKSVPFGLALAEAPTYLLRTIFPTADRTAMAPAVILWALALRGAISGRLGGAARLLGLLVAARVAIVLRSGGDWMSGWRFMVEALVPWSILTLTGLVEFIAWARERLQSPRGHLVTTGFAALVVALPLLAAPTFSGVHDATSWWRVGWATDTRGLSHAEWMKNCLAVAAHVNEHVPAGATIAFGEMGMIPFLSPQLRYLDTYGLNDRQIARLETDARTRLGVTDACDDPESDVGRHLLQRRPELIASVVPADAPAPRPLSDRYLPFSRLRLP